MYDSSAPNTATQMAALAATAASGMLYSPAPKGLARRCPDSLSVNAPRSPLTTQPSRELKASREHLPRNDVLGAVHSGNGGPGNDRPALDRPSRRRPGNFQVDSVGSTSLDVDDQHGPAGP